MKVTDHGQSEKSEQSGRRRREMRIERRGEEEREQKEAAGIERDVGKETESECLVILQFVPKGFVPPPASRSVRSVSRPTPSRRRRRRLSPK